jgi:hypothetical protein
MPGVGGLELRNVALQNAGPNSLVFQNIFVPETFRGRREETDADRAGLKRHLRVRVLSAQPRSQSLQLI